MSKNNVKLLAIWTCIVALNVGLHVATKLIKKETFITALTYQYAKEYNKEYPFIYLKAASAENEYSHTKAYELAKAVERDDLGEFERLASSDPSNLNVVGKHGLPFLIWATFRDYKYSNSALNLGCDPNAKIEYPRRVKSQKSVLSKVEKSLNTYRLWNCSSLAAAEFYSAIFDRLGGSLSDDFANLFAHLLRLKADPNVGGVSPLVIAVCANRRRDVEMLLDYNADVNGSTSMIRQIYDAPYKTSYTTPLLAAAECCNFDMMKLLIENGATCDLSTVNGRDIQRFLWLYTTLDVNKREKIFSKYHNCGFRILSKFGYNPTYDVTSEDKCKEVMRLLTAKGVSFETYAPFLSLDEYLSYGSRTGALMDYCNETDAYFGISN